MSESTEKFEKCSYMKYCDKCNSHYCAGVPGRDKCPYCIAGEESKKIRVLVYVTRDKGVFFKEIKDDQVIPPMVQDSDFACVFAIRMTPEDYQAIPATVESQKFFCE